MGCAIPTGAGITLNQIKPVENSSVAVFGLGGIGLSALIALRFFSCSQIFAIDVEDRKLALAKEFGASRLINASREEVLAVIHNATRGRGVDYSIEAAGSTSTIELAFNSVRKFGGLCVFASHPPFGKKISIDPHDLICGKRIEGSWGGACNPDVDIPKFASLYTQGNFPLEKLLSKRYKLEEINQALKDLENHQIVRALLEINPE
ncbi:MAG: zinc-binding dehydrogenase [Candidatus Ozemobacteraceae bacterium]